MIRVLATREGLQGHVTASGWPIDEVVPFVALPSHLALGKFVGVINPLNGRSVTAIVLDVGPWNTKDHAYVFQSCTMPDNHYTSVPVDLTADPEVIRPQSEKGIDTKGRPTNRAAIDLGEAVWLALGMEDNGEVEWEFL